MIRHPFTTAGIIPSRVPEDKVLETCYQALHHQLEMCIRDRYHNIHVVYTKEAETADMFIEHVTHEIGKGRRGRVATSDGMEQIIILCLLYTSVSGAPVSTPRCCFSSRWVSTRRCQFLSSTSSRQSAANCIPLPRGRGSLSLIHI